MNKKSFGIIFVVLGLVMVFAGTALYAMYDMRDSTAGQNSEKLLYRLSLDIEQTMLTDAPAIPSPEPEDPENGENLPAGDTEPEETPEMAVKNYNGLAMIGIISIPDCGIELPVLSGWSYELLEYAPCRYTGSLYTGDLIIMGHNYTSHFKPIRSAQVGAEVRFLAADGSLWTYVVDRIDVLHKSEKDRLPSAEHELSVFTCSNYGQNRFVLRCSLVSTAPPGTW